MSKHKEPRRSSYQLRTHRQSRTKDSNQKVYMLPSKNILLRPGQDQVRPQSTQKNKTQRSFFYYWFIICLLETSNPKDKFRQLQNIKHKILNWTLIFGYTFLVKIFWGCISSSTRYTWCISILFFIYQWYKIVL